MEKSIGNLAHQFQLEWLDILPGLGQAAPPRRGEDPLLKGEGLALWPQGKLPGAGAGGVGQGWGTPLQGQWEAWGASLPCAAALGAVTCRTGGAGGGRGQWGPCAWPTCSPGTPASPAPASAPSQTRSLPPPSLTAAQGGSRRRPFLAFLLQKLRSGCGAGERAWGWSEPGRDGGFVAGGGRGRGAPEEAGHGDGCSLGLVV